MSMYREPIRQGEFIVNIPGEHASFADRAFVPGDAPLRTGTVLAKPDDNDLYVPFTGANGQAVGGLLVQPVYSDQVVPGGTIRRAVLDRGPAEVTAQGGRIAFPEGADAAATEALRVKCVAGLEALGIRVR